MEWDNWNKRGCNIMTSTLENCSNCDEIEECRRYQSWFAKIPFFILDQMQRKVSSSAFRVFVYLNRRANFSPSHDHFGMCWVNYTEIEKATTVAASNMRKYVTELVKHGFIEHTHTVQTDGRAFYTTHIFTICWIRKMEEFKKLAERKGV